MRELPESLSDDGILVGWSLEAGKRRSVIGFDVDEAAGRSTARYLEPILDTGEGHLLTVAPTGAGKGTGCIIPTLLRYRGPVVVVDPKGENYAVTARRRRELGQEVILLDPFGITGSEQRHRFNPLDLADPASDRFVEDAATMAALIAGTPSENDANYTFWSQMGTSMLTAAIIDVMTMEDSEHAHLPAVRDLVNLPIMTLKERAEKWRDSGHPELRRLAGLLANPADETMGGYWAHAINQVDFLKGDQMSEHLSASDLDLNQIYEGSPLSVYLVLPPDKLESHAGLLRLWIGTIISVLTRRRCQSGLATLLIVDEAAQLGNLPQLRQAITLLRGYGVRTWTFWQDLSQLRNLYPRDWETILNNCRVQQYFGATTGLAAEAVSAASGFKSPETIMDLERDELILNIAGDQPVIAGKPNYRRDRPFQSMYDANPFYPGGPLVDEEKPRARPVYHKTLPPAPRFRALHARAEGILASRIFHPVPAKNWETLADPARREYLELAGITNTAFLEDEKIVVRTCPTPFYPGHVWCDIENSGSKPSRHAYYLAGGGSARFLNGDSTVIHDANETLLRLERANVVRYLEFFCTNVHGDKGRFLIVESVDELEWTEDPEESFLENLRAHIASPRIVSTAGAGEEPGWVVEAQIQYDGALFSACFKIDQASGEVEMVEETGIAGDLPVVSDLDRLKYIGFFAREGEFLTLKESKIALTVDGEL